MFPLAGSCCASGLKAARGVGGGLGTQVTALFVCDSGLPAYRVEAGHVRVPGEKVEIHTCSWPGLGCLLTEASEKSRWLGLGAGSRFCTQVLTASRATKKC